MKRECNEARPGLIRPEMLTFVCSKLTAAGVHFKTSWLTPRKSYVRYFPESPKIPRSGAKTTSGPVSLLRRFRTWHRAAGLALLLLLITGFWLYYGPRRLRAAKR